jgi:hypothetical protein
VQVITGGTSSSASPQVKLCGCGNQYKSRGQSNLSHASTHYACPVDTHVSLEPGEDGTCPSQACSRATAYISGRYLVSTEQTVPQTDGQSTTDWEGVTSGSQPIPQWRELLAANTALATLVAVRPLLPDLVSHLVRDRKGVNWTAPHRPANWRTELYRHSYPAAITRTTPYHTRPSCRLLRVAAGFGSMLK